MKKVILYFLMLLAVPATAQSGLFESRPHPHPHPHPHADHPHHGPLIKVGPHAHPAPHHETLGMNPRDYEEAVRIIGNETFDDRRLESAKWIVDNNPMSTKQIANICKLFTFDSNRLEFAKHAYFHCVDPNKYYLLDEVFTFGASKKELRDFINIRR